MVSSEGRSGPCREAVRRGGCLSRLRGTAEGASPVARWTMGAFRKALIVGAVLGAGAGVGSALFVLVTPGEERIQAMLKVGATGNPRWGGRTGEEPWAGGQDCEPLFLPAGDAGAGPAEQGRGGQKQTVSASYSAGGRGHAGELGREEEMDGQRRREASVSRDLPPWALGPGEESGPGELPPGEHVSLKPCTDCAFASTWRARTIGCCELKKSINHVPPSRMSPAVGHQ